MKELMYFVVAIVALTVFQVTECDRPARVPERSGPVAVGVLVEWSGGEGSTQTPPINPRRLAEIIGGVYDLDCGCRVYPTHRRIQECTLDAPADIDPDTLEER